MDSVVALLMLARIAPKREAMTSPVRWWTRARGARAACIIAAVAAQSAFVSWGVAQAAIPAWTTYRHDAARSGIDPESGAPSTPARIWRSAPLDGQVYAEPLAYGPYVYVATENDTIYALEAASGRIVWQQHLGTAVPRSELPCGSIEPVAGITSTPVIDPVTDTLYAVTDNWEGTQESIRHKLIALDLSTGAMRAGFPIEVDPPFPAGGSARQQLQRPALALWDNEVVIGYGGNNGDCGTYWGWLVAAPESGVGAPHYFQVEGASGHHGGAIWGSGNGPPVDSAGYLYAASGNGYSGGSFDLSESVMRFEAPLTLAEYWAPVEWLELDSGDADLGSSEPVLLPDGLLFEIGKQGVGVLLRSGALGGLGATPLAKLGVCGGSWGGGIYVPASASSGTIYVTCSDGLHALAVSGLDTPAPALAAAPAWSVNGNVVGPPIFAGGLVWVASYTAGILYGLDPVSGAARFEERLGTFEHFASPGAGGGLLFAASEVGAGETAVSALRIAPTPPPTATATALASSLDPAPAATPVTFTAAVSPVPDSGTVTFTDGGAPISGCAEVRVSFATGGRASCYASGLGIGVNTIVASYSGDPYYTSSASAPLQQSVGALTVADARESHGRWREGRALPQIHYTASPQPAVGHTARARRAHRAPLGTSFSFQLDKSASVRLAFSQTLSGRRVGKRCLVARAQPRRGRRPHATSCRRNVTVATVVLAGHAGVDAVHFEGRTSRSHKLRPGRYTLVITAVAGSERASAGGLSFTIVKR
jgi:outer membrane protein assembly factor BamB